MQNQLSNILPAKDQPAIRAKACCTGIALLFLMACGGSGAHSSITVTAETPESVEHGDAVNVNNMLGVTTAELDGQTLTIGGSVAPMPTMVLDYTTISDPDSETEGDESEEDDGAL